MCYSIQDISARLQSIAGPDGVALRSDIQYTATGKVQSEYRVNLYITYTYYPGNDRLQRVSEFDGSNFSSRITEWTYLPTGEVASITQGAGTSDATTLSLTYDSARRLTRITDGLGNYMDYVLDSEGNVEKENIYDNAGVLKKTLTQTFDNYNRLDNYSETNQAINRDFNANGTLAKSTDGKGVVTNYAYDSLKRLTSMTQNVGGTDVTTANALTKFGYDVQDHLTSVTDANNGITSYVYDDLGNVVSITSPDSGTTRFTHDTAGNVLTKTDAKGQVFSYSYDAFNRLKTVDTTGSSDDMQLSYDSCTNGQGRVCKLSRNTLTNRSLTETSYQYTAMGNVSNLAQSVVTFQGYSVADNALAYSYDNAGRLKTITYPGGGVVTQGYDDAGQLNAMALDVNGTHTDLLNVSARHPFGVIANATYGNGQNINGFVYGDYRLSSLFESLQYTTLQYDQNGNPIQMTYPQGQSNFTYDAHQRLDTVSGTLGSYNFDYDKVGNKKADGAGQSITYQASSNRMNMLDGVAVSPDANGNTQTLRGMTLNYTADNLLKSVNTGVAFEYNALNQRSVKRTTASGSAGQLGYSSSTVYLYGLSHELLAEMGPTGQVKKEYIYLEGKPLAMLDYTPSSNEAFLKGDLDKDGVISMEDTLIWYFNHRTNNAYEVTGDGINNQADIDKMFACGNTQNSCVAASYSTSIYYLHNDHLGTPKAMTNSAGQIVWNQTATPFGKATVNNDYDGDGKSVTLNIRQPGQYYDFETGLYYNLHRYYDPATGRYITSDPIGLKGGVNTFAYVVNNPLNGVDPSGLFVATVNYGGGPYGSVTMVWNSWLPTFYQSGSAGDNGTHIESGVYTYNYGQHPMNPPPGKTPYSALNLTTRDGSRTLPATRTDGKGDSATGINVHRGNSPSNPKSGSQGCHVIPGDKYDDFISQFGDGDSGTYIYIRLLDMVQQFNNMFGFGAN
jgi:RHS repeat-associated protein